MNGIWHHRTQQRDRAGMARVAMDGAGWTGVDDAGNAADGADGVRTGAKFGMKSPYLQQWRHAVFLRRSDGRTRICGEQTR
jgi:hypothetical protein